MRGLSLLLTVAVFLLPSFAFAQGQSLAHRVAVVPFYAPGNPDYGVFMADRLAYEFYQHAYVPALERTRLVLIETDTLQTDIQKAIHQAGEEIDQRVLDVLRREIPASYLFTGMVEFTGIQLISLKLIDLESGRVIWKGRFRDNPSWVWTQSHRTVGEIPMEKIRLSLGFGSGGIPAPSPKADQLPREILLQPLYTNGLPLLAADCEARIRSAIERDGLFSLVPGTLKSSRGELRVPRLDTALRAQAGETTLADAVLCGSLLTLGKDNSADNIAVVLRLVDVSTGQLLWVGSSTGRRVWRWDKTADIMANLTSGLTEDLAQYGASAAETALADLRANAKDGASWANLGQAYLTRGLLKQAGAAFEKALELGGAEARARTGLGQIALRRGDAFEQGLASLKAAIKADPKYLDAYCLLAQAYLDRDMPDGLQFAHQAIAIDPEFALPYRVLGDWHADQEENRKARGFYETYLSKENDDIEVAARFGRVLLRLRDYEGIDRWLAPILRDRPEATALLPVLGIKSFRVQRYRDAEEFFERFLNQIDVRERNLYEDIRTLLTADEQVVYAGLEGRSRKVFEDRFWREKDPDLSQSVNARRLEHFERVWLARYDFGRVIYPWDRRGEVFIRYGVPDYRSRSGWVPTLPSTRVQEVKEKVYRALYQNSPEGELVGPVFPIRSDQGMGIAQEEEFETLSQQGPQSEQNTGLERSQIRGGFRSNMSQEAYAPVTMQHDRSIVPWESWVYVDIEGGLVFDFTREMGGVSGFDFAPLPAIPPTMLRANIRLAEYAPQLAYERAIANDPESFRPPTIRQLDHFYYDLIDFRGGTYQSRVDVAYSVPLTDLVVMTDGEQPQVVLERAVAFADSSYTVVYRQARKVQFDVDTASVGVGNAVDVMRQDLSPGLYHMTLTVTDVMSGRIGKLQRDVRIEPYGVEALQLSDLMLVSTVSDTLRDIRFRRGGWEVIPNPPRAYRPPRSLAFYCEVYNLVPDEFGQTHYRVTTAIKKVDADRRTRPGAPIAQPEVALSYEQVGNQKWERLPLEVDLGNAQLGRNRLFVVIEDLNTGAKVAKETYFDYIQ